MQTNEIDGVVSLLSSKNIVIIHMLINSASITPETLAIALKKMYAAGRSLNAVEFVVEIVNLIESIYDNELLCNLLNDLITNYANNLPRKNDIVFQNCFEKMSNLCPLIKITHDWLYLPTNLFFYHVTNIDTVYIDLDVMKYATNNNNYNEEICNWIVDEWISLSAYLSSIKNICHLAKNAYHRVNTIIFEKLMQVICDRFLNDILLINILLFSTIDDRNIKYVLDCKYSDKLLFYRTALDIHYARFHKFELSSESKNLELLIEKNDSARKIYDYVTGMNKMRYEIYDDEFDDMICQITLLMEIYIQNQ
jgi:hypothetical protein